MIVPLVDHSDPLFHRMKYCGFNLKFSECYGNFILFYFILKVAVKKWLRIENFSSSKKLQSIIKPRIVGLSYLGRSDPFPLFDVLFLRPIF